MSDHFVSWLQNGVTITVLAGLILTRVAEGSKHVADLLGPLGRKVRERSQRREMVRTESIKREFQEAMKQGPDYQALMRRIEIMDRLIHEMEAEIKTLKRSKELDAQDRDMNAAYIGYTLRYQGAADIFAAEMGFELPPRTTYTEFCRKYRAERGRPPR